MVKAGFQPETLAEDSYEYVDRDGDPYLSLHSVLAGAIERIDAQVLLDPLEEQFHLPAAFVNLRDGECGKQEVVGQEPQPLFGFRVEVGDAPQWVRVKGIAKGRLHDHRFQSVILGNERQVQVYTPPGYADSDRQCGLLLAFDGPWNLAWMPTTLDNLLAEGRIPPLVAVFVDTTGPNRNRELGLSGQFAEFLSTELMPWIRQHYQVSTDARQVVVTGASAGGLAAGFLALRHPELFGNVLSQSGTRWWWLGYQLGDDYSNVPAADQGWLITQYSTAPRLPLKFYIDVGLQEADPGNEGFWFSNLAANRRLRDVLRAKDYPVHYAEFNGGHDVYAWRATFPTGLIALVGK